MKKAVKDAAIFVGLAAAGITVLNALGGNRMGASAGTSGLGAGRVTNPIPPHPSTYHATHPWWRWYTPSTDANWSQHGNTAYSPWAMPWWDQTNTFDSPYGGGGGYGGGYDPYWDYSAQVYEQPGSLAYEAAQYD